MARLCSIAVLSALMAMCWSGPGLAQDIGQDDDVASESLPVTYVADVPVLGRTREAVTRFVADLSVSNGRHQRGQLARFDHRICPGVAHMRPDFAQVIVDRIALAALEVGLRVGAPGCRPNILVVAARDVDALMPLLVESQPRVFLRHARDVGATDSLNAFRDVSRPVRWWHVTEEVGAGSGSTSTTRGGEMEVVQTAFAGHITSPMQTHIVGAVLVLDLDQMPEIGLEALGDYLAMTALARLNPDEDTSGVPTVLNLFQPDATDRPDGLTDFDRAYLEALYKAPRNARRRGSQESHIVWRMMRNQSLERD